MKRLTSVLLAFVMIFALATPCFAAEIDESQITPYTTTTKTVYDSKGNSYSVKGNSTISGYTGIVYTRFTVKTCGSGLVENLTVVDQTASTNASVYFSDGTTPNYSTLDKSNSFYDVDGVGDTRSVEKSYSFTAFIESISCTHTFTTTYGGSVSFTTGALAS